MLEEPEHLTWYHHGTRWTDKFNHVVGIMHTNYLDYARREEGGEAKARMLEAYNNWVCRVHCHKERHPPARRRCHSSRQSGARLSSSGSAVRQLAVQPWRNVV